MSYWYLWWFSYTETASEFVEPCPHLCSFLFIRFFIETFLMHPIFLISPFEAFCYFQAVLIICFLSKPGLFKLWPIVWNRCTIFDSVCLRSFGIQTNCYCLMPLNRNVRISFFIENKIINGNKLFHWDPRFIHIVEIIKF